jgi:hypothetical protein
MKRSLFSALLVMFLTTSSFADTNPTYVISRFHNQFSAASNVTWSIKPEFVEISFTKNNEQAFAYYDLDGQFLGTCRNVSLDKLPVKVQNKLLTKYAEYNINQVIEFITPVETAYYIYSNNDDKKIVLKASNTSISFFKKL